MMSFFQVYQSICFTRLLELAPFADAFGLERVIVDCVRHNDMQIRVDHRSRTVHFGTNLAQSSSGGGGGLAGGPSSECYSSLIELSRETQFVNHLF